jgi:hypothetical protein
VEMRPNRRPSFWEINDKYKYLLTVIDGFSIYLHIVPLKSKSGTAVTSAFELILENPKYSKLYKDSRSGFERIRENNF